MLKFLLKLKNEYEKFVRVLPCILVFINMHVVLIAPFYFSLIFGTTLLTTRFGFFIYRQKRVL